MPIFIDFEASGLGSDSYPIEVAWSFEDGSIESHLINPAYIPEWTDWSEASQKIHNITCQQLYDEGKHPKWVAERMNDVLADKVVLSNAAEYDWDWCDTLFRALNIQMNFNFGDSWHVFRNKLQLEQSISDVMLDQKVTIERMNHELMKVSEEAWKRVTGERHRAAVDVQQLIEMYKLVLEKNNAFKS